MAKTKAAPNLKGPKIIAELKKLDPKVFDKYILCFAKAHEKDEWQLDARDHDHKHVFSGVFKDGAASAVAKAIKAKLK